MSWDPTLGDATSPTRSVTKQRYRTGGTLWVVVIFPYGKVVFNDYHVNAERLVTHLCDHLLRRRLKVQRENAQLRPGGEY